MECVRPVRRLLEFWCHVETLGAAQAKVEPRGLRQNLLETSPLLLSLTPTGSVEGKGNSSETAVPVISSWRWYHLEQMRKTDLPHQQFSVHSGAQPGEAEASSTARE